ncbi:hypothetical protein SAM9427_36730 (plasmid) [Streptomyces sp. ETH9427]|uniref:HK97 family phage prohead protease n=1 Tax=Streptomyces sp. E1N211 TaxID=1851876 RepID=UPI000E0C99A7|nr:HK97 family phage prohead protease [Streptomyces sp. E1N211]AXI91318.1 hypothetical protein SAM9427_36730 [Streptomyces sp. ETH9427]
MPSSPPTVRRRGKKGIVRAIYAVTGVVDDVEDLILPGAFTRTLNSRRVKPVWHHDWKEPVGSVLSVEEWMPGDPRFASIPGGAVWPAAAGALVATVQYNLRTTRGRDAYEQVMQWHENGEAQFSIGFKVPPGGASKRHDGVRIINDLDLYEISPVLHGAHPMTRSIEVKAASTQQGRPMELKATWSAVELKAAEQQVGDGVMVALQVPRDVAEKIAHPDGTAAEHLHITLAYLGSVGELGGHPDDLRDIVTPAVADSGPLTGSIGGIGRFPDSGDGEPTWVPVDVPGLAELRQYVTQALATSVYSEAVRDDHGFTPHITLGYSLPDIPPVPSTPVTFSSVHVVRGEDEFEIPLGDTPTEEPARAPAPRPQREPAGRPTRDPAPPLEGKSAARIVVEAKASGGWDKNRGKPATHAAETKSAARVVLEAKSAQPVHLPERIMTSPMPYSFEQIRDELAKAARALFSSGKEGDYPSGPTGPAECYVSVEATYPDRVIVTRYDDGEQSYSIPYTTSGRDVALGVPVPVKLTTVATPITGVERPVGVDEAVHARYIQPTGRALDDAATLIEVSDATPEHLEGLKPTVDKLLRALTKKGLPMDKAPDGGDDWLGEYTVTDGWDDDEDTPENEVDYDDYPEDTAAAVGDDEIPYADTEPAAVPPGNTPADEEVDEVTLDPAEVKAALAGLAL